MKWFKHYNMASEGESCLKLIAEKDYESLYIYWWLLEQVSRLEKEESRGEVTLNLSYFKMKLGQNRQRITKVLSKIAQTFEIKIDINSDESVKVFVPKWAELQENRGGKRESNAQAKTEQNSTDIRSKNKEERTKNKDTEQEASPAVQIVVDLWNSFSQLPKVKALNESRKKKIKSRLSEPAFDYQKAIPMILESDFLMGRTGNWKASFDWFIENDSNYLKVLEGNYSKKSGQSKPTQGQNAFDVAKAQIDAINRGEL